MKKYQKKAIFDELRNYNPSAKKAINKLTKQLLKNE